MVDLQQRKVDKIWVQNISYSLLNIVKQINANDKDSILEFS